MGVSRVGGHRSGRSARRDQDLRSRAALNDSFFPLGSWAKPNAAAWDGFARLSRESGGMIVLWLDNADPLASRADVPATLDPRCREAQVRTVSAPRRGHEIVATTSTAAPCPLTFATNFTEDLRATAVLVDGSRVDLAPFPAQDALAQALHIETPRVEPRGGEV